MIVKRLSDHLEGKLELTQTQVRAGEILLRKVMPDLSTQQVEGHIEHSFADLLRTIDAIRRGELGQGVRQIDQQPVIVYDPGSEGNA